MTRRSPDSYTTSTVSLSHEATLTLETLASRISGHLSGYTHAAPQCIRIAVLLAALGPPLVHDRTTRRQFRYRCTVYPLTLDPVLTHALFTLVPRYFLLKSAAVEYGITTYTEEIYQYLTGLLPHEQNVYKAAVATIPRVPFVLGARKGPCPYCQSPEGFMCAEGCIHATYP